MQAGYITVDGRPVGTIDIRVMDGREPPPELLLTSYSDDGTVMDHGDGPMAWGDHRGSHDTTHERRGTTDSHEPHRSHQGPSEREIQREATPDQPLPDPAPEGSDRVYGRLAEARDRARQELKDKPWLREKARHIFAGENEDPEAQVALWEETINRAAVRGTSVEKELRHTSEGGYYKGRRGYVSEDMRQQIDRARDRALNYSNVSNYATDNSSSWLAAKESRLGTFVDRKVIAGEHFKGPDTRIPTHTSTWHELVTESHGIHQGVKALEGKGEEVPAAATGENKPSAPAPAQSVHTTPTPEGDM